MVLPSKLYNIVPKCFLFFICSKIDTKHNIFLIFLTEGRPEPFLKHMGVNWSNIVLLCEASENWGKVFSLTDFAKISSYAHYAIAQKISGAFKPYLSRFESYFAPNVHLVRYSHFVPLFLKSSSFKNRWEARITILLPFLDRTRSCSISSDQRRQP